MQPHQQPTVHKPNPALIIETGDGRIQATFPLQPFGSRPWTAKLQEAAAGSSFAPGVEVSVDDSGRGISVIGPREHFNPVLKQQLDALAMIASHELTKSTAESRAASQSTMQRIAQLHKDNADTLKKMGF